MVILLMVIYQSFVLKLVVHVHLIVLMMMILLHHLGVPLQLQLLDVRLHGVLMVL